MNGRAVLSPKGGVKFENLRFSNTSFVLFGQCPKFCFAKPHKTSDNIIDNIIISVITLAFLIFNKKN